MNVINEAIKMAETQANLAELTGLSQAAISKLSTGKSEVSASSALKIEAALNGKISKERLCPKIFKAEK